MSMTFAQLKLDIQRYTEVSETSFNDTVDTFVRNAEERMLKNVQANVFRKQTSISLTSGTSSRVVMPDDFLAPLSVTVRVTQNEVQSLVGLELKDHAFVVENDSSTAASGIPKYYAVVSSSETDADGKTPVTELRVSPKSNATYTMTVNYLYRPQSLVDVSTTQAYGDTAVTGTTWLSTNAPRALLFGALVEAYIFLKGEPDLLALYEQQFQESLAGLKLLGEAKETQDEYRVGQLIRQKQ
tara:strand:+ start:1521 stop:2243 length:723 start_codon:yes stop_codon:yes gene_type:complete